MSDEMIGIKQDYYESFFNHVFDLVSSGTLMLSKDGSRWFVVYVEKNGVVVRLDHDTLFGGLKQVKAEVRSETTPAKGDQG